MKFFGIVFIYFISLSCNAQHKEIYAYVISKAEKSNCASVEIEEINQFFISKRTNRIFSIESFEKLNQEQITIIKDSLNKTTEFLETEYVFEKPSFLISTINAQEYLDSTYSFEYKIDGVLERISCPDFTLSIQIISNEESKIIGRYKYSKSYLKYHLGYWWEPMYVEFYLGQNGLIEKFKFLSHTPKTKRQNVIRGYHYYTVKYK